nr:MAG TPA: hypothetical protein [Herelleviridae sp.]
MGSVKSRRKLMNHIKGNIKEGLFTISTKKELAKAVNLSVSTVNNALKELEQEKRIVVVSKKGHKGGLVIALVEHQYDKEDLREYNLSDDDLVTSTKKYAQDLKEKHFPDYKYQRKENRRRTKLEMIEYNAVKDKHRKMLLDMNFKLSTMNYPTKEIFYMVDDSEGYYKAYLLCKLYDQYCIAHIKARKEKYEHKMLNAKTKDEKVRYKKFMEFYDSQIPTMVTKNSETKNFFGSRNFNTFYNFYNKVKDIKGFNIFKYMQNVFNVISFKYENGYQKQFIPSPNYFSSEKHLQSYTNYLKGIKRNVNNTQRHIGSDDTRIDSSTYVKNPLVVQLQEMYVLGLNNTLHNVDEMFKNAMDLEELEYGITNDKQLLLLNLVYNVEDKIKDLPEYEKELMTKFVKQLVVNEYAPMSISPITRTAMFMIQREHMRNVLEFGKQTLTNWTSELGIVSFDDGHLTQEYRNSLEYTMTYYMILSKYSTNYYVTRMYSDYMGYEVNMREVEYIIDKYDLERLIPLDKYGMLDIDKLEEDV